MRDYLAENYIARLGQLELLAPICGQKLGSDVHVLCRFRSLGAALFKFDSI